MSLSKSEDLAPSGVGETQGKTTTVGCLSFCTLLYVSSWTPSASTGGHVAVVGRRRFRHDPEDQQNRKKPTIRHDAQPTSNSGDNGIDQLDCAETGSPGGAAGRSRVDGFRGAVQARFRWEDYRRASEPRRPDFPQVRRPSHPATPDREGKANADRPWGLGPGA